MAVAGLRVGFHAEEYDWMVCTVEEPVEIPHRMSLHNMGLVPLPNEFAVAHMKRLIPNVARHAEIPNMYVVDMIGFE